MANIEEIEFGLKTPEVSTVHRKSLYLSMISEAGSRGSSLYDSVASLGLNVSNFPNFDDACVEEIMEKNREISDCISNRLTALIYFSSTLATHEDIRGPISESESEFSSALEESNGFVEQQESTKDCFEGNEIIKKLIVHAKNYLEKQRQLEGNLEEIRRLEEQHAGMKNDVSAFIKELDGDRIENNTIFQGCKCEIL